MRTQREEEIESEGRCGCRRRRPGLELEPRLRPWVRARANVEVGETRAWNNTPEFHGLYFAFVGLLHVHIQHLYHGDASPFQTHPISMRISVVAIFSYGLAALFGRAQFGSNYSQIFDYVIMVLGVLYPVSLITVFISNWLSCLLYISWLIFSVMVVPWGFSLVCSSQWILQKSGILLFNMATCPLELKLLAYNGLLLALLLLALLPWPLLPWPLLLPWILLLGLAFCMPWALLPWHLLPWILLLGSTFFTWTVVATRRYF